MTTAADGNARIQYSPWQMALHWAIAALIGFQFLLNGGIEAAFDRRMDVGEAQIGLAALLHMATGTVILVLAAVRLTLRFRLGAPAAHASNPAIINALAAMVHGGLYVTIFAMPLIGLGAWWFRNDVLSELHEVGGDILLWLVFFHVSGAIVEHVLLGNDSIGRMMP